MHNNVSFAETVGNLLIQYENELLFFCLLGTLVLSAFIETLRPRRTQKRSQLSRRWPVNFGMLLINQINATWLTALSAVMASWWTTSQNIELVTYLDTGFWTSLLLAIALFELINYWFHRLLHSVPVLWRIHAIHHSDREVDFSTTFRNHPLELLIIAPITIPLVILLGFPVAAVVFYQALRIVVLVFAHSNLHIPEQVDRYLRWFITTPDYHRIHHSSDRVYTDSNFAPMFPLYDHLFGTYKTRPYTELDSMDVGLEYMRKPSETRFIDLLLAPFIWKSLYGKESRGSGLLSSPTYHRGPDAPPAAKEISA